MNNIEKHYKAHREQLVKFYTRALGYHDAEDAVQDAYVRALSYIKFDVDYETFSKWMSGIIKNCVKDKLKDKVNNGKVVDENLVGDGLDHSPEEIQLFVEQVGILREKILKKKMPDQFILTLFFLNMEGYNTIKKLIPNVSYGQIRNVIYKFREEYK